jgi:arginyl-tRNA synthetase
MRVPMSQTVLALLADRLEAAARLAFGDDVPLPTTLVVPTRDPRHGDYSSPVAMSLAKTVGQPPLAIAERLASTIDVADVSEAAEVTPPGFVNFRLRREWMAGRLASGELVASRTEDPRKVVVDYSGPNMAKEMHVGHLRSTIIGDAIANIHERLGDTVQRVNHVGDFGAAFGRLLAHMEEAEAGEGLAITDVEDFYREASERDKSDEAFRERARQRVVEFQTGEPRAIAAWRTYLELTREGNDEVYRLLGVYGLVEKGESSYGPALGDLVDELEEKGLLVEDQGAKVVFPEGFANKEGERLPIIVQYRHGAFGYAATDLAALRHRLVDEQADRVVYVVDQGQSQHLEMVFAVARMAGWVRPGVEIVHVPFGLVLGEDNKRLRTRDGENVRLRELLGEAIARAREFVVARAEERGDAPPDDVDEVARVIGVGAVKYADLSQNRQSNYVFSYDRMLSLKGNTAPYLQYAYARILSILRDSGAWKPAPPVLDDAAEVELAKALVAVGDAVARVVEDDEPNHLCAQLYEVAQAFSRFYEACPVLRSEEPVRTSRLVLCDRTAAALREGLALLGIEVLERL